MIYEKIYKNLIRLIPLESLKENGGYVKLTSTGYMDLHVDRLHKTHPKGKQDGCFIISMAHNFIQNGDTMADPDMEIAIYPEMGMAEALTYQLDSLGMFQRVYPKPGFVDLRTKKELNIFLDSWLATLKKQGFYQ